MSKEVRTFWKWVDKRSREVGIVSFRELERKAGVANGTIYARKKESKYPTVEMAEGLCEALQVSWITLWTEAGYVAAFDKDDVAFRELLEIIKHLSPNDREEIIRYARYRLYSQESQSSVEVTGKASATVYT